MSIGTAFVNFYLGDFSRLGFAATSIALSAEQQTPDDCWAAPEDIALQYDLITEWDDCTGNFSSPQDRQQFREYPTNAQNSLSVPKPIDPIIPWHPPVVPDPDDPCIILSIGNANSNDLHLSIGNAKCTSTAFWMSI